MPQVGFERRRELRHHFEALDAETLPGTDAAIGSIPQQPRLAAAARRGVPALIKLGDEFH
jgi:hypothetical protein